MAAKIVQFPGAGCVVEFMQGNLPQIAWVMEEQGGKARLLLPNRRETSLPTNRLLPWAGPRYDGNKSKDDIAALLQSHKEKRDTMSAMFVPVDLWELAQGEMEKASAEWLAELVENEPDVDAVAACAHALLDCKSHFKFQPPEFEIYSTETVETRRHAEEANKEREALVGGGANWLKYLWDARMAHKPVVTENEVEKHAPQEPVRGRLIRLLRNRIIDPETSDDDHLWKQVNKGLPDDPHLPLLLATTWGLVPEHYNYWLERADYDAGDDWAAPFADELADIQARAKQPQSEPLKGFISIDSATTRDIDDAFYMEARPDGGWRVSIALASPAQLWTFGSPLDKAVARRATSIYLPEGDYHMLPEQLGTSACSLHADQPRPAFIVRCDVAEDGSPLASTLESAWVSLAANLTYLDCEAVLTGGETANSATPYAEQLAMGSRMAQARLAWRVAQGAVVIDRPDSDCYLVGEGFDTKVFLKENPPAPTAQLLVSEMMILANAAVASWAQERQVSLLFRAQDVAIPPEFAGVWSAAPDIARVVRALASATLETTPRPHASMGLSAYCTITSPLRRYVDLLNEAQILHTLEHGEPRWTKEEMDAMLSPLSLRLDAAGQVQRFRPRYWKYLYLQQQAKQHGDACAWDAIVAEENDIWVSVSLPREQLNIRGKRQLFGEKVFPGQALKLRLGKINPLRTEVSILAVQEGDE